MLGSQTPYKQYALIFMIACIIMLYFFVFTIFRSFGSNEQFRSIDVTNLGNSQIKKVYNNNYYYYSFISQSSNVHDTDNY